MGCREENAVNGHCAVIINRYVLNLPGLKCLIDSDRDIQGSMFMGYPVIDPSEIQDNNIDIIIIASKGSRSNIRENIRRTAPSVGILTYMRNWKRKALRQTITFLVSRMCIQNFTSRSIYMKHQGSPL